MADFPTSIYSPRTKENRSGVVYDPTKTKQVFAEDITKLDAEVVAIENTIFGFGQYSVELSSSDILNLHDTPVEVLPAPANGKINILDFVAIILVPGDIPYQNGDWLYVRYKNSFNNLLQDYLPASCVKDTVQNLAYQKSSSAMIINDGVAKAIEIVTFLGNAFTSGNGSLKVFVKYHTISV